MVSIEWCCRQKGGIRLIEPNDNLAEGYIKMAENAIGTMIRERELNLAFSISACYYSMYYSLYYSLYSVLMKLGIKCEIHSCTLEFMKSFLTEFYSSDDAETIEKAFDARNKVQYYVDKIIKDEEIDFIVLQAPFFLNKSKEILSKLNQNNINELRSKVLNLKAK